MNRMCPMKSCPHVPWCRIAFTCHTRYTASAAATAHFSHLAGAYTAGVGAGVSSPVGSDVGSNVSWLAELAGGAEVMRGSEYRGVPRPRQPSGGVAPPPRHHLFRRRKSQG